MLVSRAMMNLLRTSFVLILLLAATGTPHAQRKFETSKTLGLTVGTGYYLGEVNPNGHFKGRMQPGFGGFLRFNINRRMGIRASLNRTVLMYYDADNEDPWIANRNLHFRNAITEGAVVAEFNYSRYQIGNTKDRFAGYLFAGLSLYSHMPEAQIGDTWYALQPLGTEGQGTSSGEGRYATTGFAVPFGFGFKLNLGHFSALNIEWGMRRTWTDHLDDIAGYYASTAVLEDESGPLAEELSEARIEREGGLVDPVGQMRGYNGLDDRFAVMTASFTFRIDKSPTTCWNR
ncbi:MAG: hypothetical protein ISP54_01335 [Flavobacteriales bacterium]|nr:hypothetical protein [Flavobacteriales bacterium]